MTNLKNLFYLIPIYFYYLLESLFIGLILNLIWKFGFQERINFKLEYIDIVLIVWVIKILLFDVFKITTNFNEINKINTNN